MNKILAILVVCMLTLLICGCNDENKVDNVKEKSNQSGENTKSVENIEMPDKDLMHLSGEYYEKIYISNEDISGEENISGDEASTISAYSIIKNSNDKVESDEDVPFKDLPNDAKIIYKISGNFVAKKKYAEAIYAVSSEDNKIINAELISGDNLVIKSKIGDYKFNCLQKFTLTSNVKQITIEEGIENISSCAYEGTLKDDNSVTIILPNSLKKCESSFSGFKIEGNTKKSIFTDELSYELQQINDNLYCIIDYSSSEWLDYINIPYNNHRHNYDVALNTFYDYLDDAEQYSTNHKDEYVICYAIISNATDVDFNNIDNFPPEGFVQVTEYEIDESSQVVSALLHFATFKVKNENDINSFASAVTYYMRHNDTYAINSIGCFERYDKEREIYLAPFYSNLITESGRVEDSYIDKLTATRICYKNLYK